MVETAKTTVFNLLTASRPRSPSRAGLVGQAEHYPSSSAQAHAGERDAAGLIDWARWRARYPENRDGATP